MQRRRRFGEQGGGGEGRGGRGGRGAPFPAAGVAPLAVSLAPLGDLQAAAALQLRQLLLQTALPQDGLVLLAHHPPQRVHLGAGVSVHGLHTAGGGGVRGGTHSQEVDRGRGVC